MDRSDAARALPTTRKPNPGLPDAPAAWEREDFDRVHFALAE
ncbi:MAG: hypothetical protein AAF773_15845 [Cyanobacteria bacterium P01_D01_bin.115]